MNCRLCYTCWNFWKKYGGLKIASRLSDTEMDALKKRGNNEIEEEKVNDLTNRPIQRYFFKYCCKYIFINIQHLVDLSLDVQLSIVVKNLS